MIVQGLPDHVTTGLHLCRGDFRGMWMVDAKLDPIAERFFGLPYDVFLVEWDDTSRMGDYAALRGVPAGGPTVAMGLVSTKAGALEDEDELGATSRRRRSWSTSTSSRCARSVASRRRSPATR